MKGIKQYYEIFMVTLFSWIITIVEETKNNHNIFTQLISGQNGLWDIFMTILFLWVN